MIKFEIMNRWSRNVQITAEIDCDENEEKSIKLGLAVKWAVKNNLSLDGADLYGANLNGANLNHADLLLCTGNFKNIKTISVEGYAISYTSDRIQIGCQNHSIEDWKQFSDAEIRAMDGKKAIDFWVKWKDWLFMTIEMSPAEPTNSNGD